MPTVSLFSKKGMTNKSNAPFIATKILKAEMLDDIRRDKILPEFLNSVVEYFKTTCIMQWLVLVSYAFGVIIRDEANVTRMTTI